MLRRVVDQPAAGGGEIGGERDVVERERAAGVAERRGAHQSDPAPGLAAQRLDGLDRAARAREVGELALDLDEEPAAGAHASSGGRPTETTAAPLVTASRSRGGSSCAAQMLPASGPGKTARPSASTAATSSPAPPSPSGVAMRQHAELRHRLPEAGGEASGGRLHDRVAAAIAAELAGCVVDRLLRIVEGEVEAHYFRHQRASATARRCPATPPASSRSACRRMLHTCRSCSRVKPIAPVN